MPKEQKNPEIGKVDCQSCGAKSSVRRDAGERLYYFCPNCKMVNPKGESFQKWMQEHAIIDDAGPNVDPDPGPAPDDTPSPKPAPKPVATPEPAAVIDDNDDNSWLW